MKVTGQVARMMIDYLKAYVLEGGYKAEGKTGKILEMTFKDEIFCIWVNAYAEFVPKFRENFRKILMNLSSPREGKYESIFQKELLSATSMNKLSIFESRLKRALALPFEEYVNLALKCLPEGTPIDTDIYITLDPIQYGDDATNT